MPEFIKSYVGHSRKITGISQLHSEKRFFVSSATDKSLLLWNTNNEENELIYSSKVEIKSISSVKDDLILIEERTIKLINPFKKKSKSIFKTSSNITC